MLDLTAARTGEALNFISVCLRTKAETGRQSELSRTLKLYFRGFGNNFELLATPVSKFYKICYEIDVLKREDTAW
jgi:hypothetical protein